MIKFASLFLLTSSLVACATDDSSSNGGSPRPSKREAAHAVAAASAGLGEAGQAAQSQQSRGRAPVASTVDAVGACELGGTFDVSGSYDYDLTGSSEFDLDTTFAACAVADGTLDGQVRWQQQLAGTSITETITGTLDWQGVDAAASCTFDLTLSIDAGAIHYSGTACGYDVETELADELAGADIQLGL